MQPPPIRRVEPRHGRKVLGQAGPGKSRIIRSTHGAAVFLLYRWPGEVGPQHKAAREACIATLAGEKPPDHARQAFIEAAKEAGILREYDW
jgi:hypothetical protein